MALTEEDVTALAQPARRTASKKTFQIKTTNVVIDLIVASAGIGAATALVDGGRDWRPAAVAMLLAWAFWFGRARMYSARFITRRADEVRRIFDAGMLVAASIAVSSFVFDWSIRRWWLVLAVAFAAVALTLEREVMRRRYDRMRVSGKFRRDVLMIGDNHESEQLERMFAEEPKLGYNIVETIDPKQAENPQQLVTTVLAAARAANATGVIVAATGIETKASNRLIRDLIDAGIHVELSSTLADIAPKRLTVRPLGRFPVVYVEPVQRHGWRAVAKRTFDVVVASLALLAASPVLAVLALLIKRGSEGPIVFRQSRVGKDGIPFEVLKFRTMVVNAEEILADLMEHNEGAGPLFKMKDDPRITKTGAFLRKTSLDELPQLWNVVRGEMSLVGPRPALASEMAEWDADLYGRLRVKPGITGMWQVSGRSSTTFEEYTRLDLYYVDNWSLVVDLAILAKTIPAVLKSDGAY